MPVKAGLKCCFYNLNRECECMHSKLPGYVSEDVGEGVIIGRGLVEMEFIIGINIVFVIIFVILEVRDLYCNFCQCCKGTGCCINSK